MGLMIVILALFLVADHLGKSGNLGIGSSSSPVAGSSGSGSGTATSASKAAASPTSVDTAALRSPQEVADAYVKLWSSSNYSGMYQLLSTTSKQVIKESDFVGRYTGIADEVGQQSLTATVTNTSGNSTRIPIHVVWQSGKVGEIQEDNVLTVVQDGGTWRVDWTPSMIFTDLGDGFVRWIPDVPQRGRILDRKGRPLAALGTITKVGVEPGQIKDEASMLQQLSKLLDMPQDQIKALYASGQPDWFMPIRSYPDNMDPNLLKQFQAIPGVVLQKWPDRVYPAGPATAQIVGYLSEVTSDELKTMSKQGYGPGDRIGRAGLEAWGEKYLAGTRGGRLVIVGPDGSERKTIKEIKSAPADDIVTTIDLDVQLAAAQALGDKWGSVVVIDPATGGILAMVSNPTYDPNQFILGMSSQQWTDLNDPTKRPLENRATQVAYPIGSTFKVVTMTAGMQSLGLTEQSTFNCPAASHCREPPRSGTTGAPTGKERSPCITRWSSRATRSSTRSRSSSIRRGRIFFRMPPRPSASAR